MRTKVAAQKKEAAKKRAAAAAAAQAAKPAPVVRKQQSKRTAPTSNAPAGEQDQMQQVLMQMFATAYKKYLEDAQKSGESPMAFEDFANLAYQQMAQMAQSGELPEGFDGAEADADAAIEVDTEAAAEEAADNVE